MIRMPAALTACALTIVLGFGCSEHPTSPAPPAPPSPGSAVVSLATPNSDDGAVIVTLRGPSGAAISALQVYGTGMQFYTRMASDSEARVIIVGNVSAGPLFTFKPAAGAAITAYSGAVTQVATRGDSLRASLSGYQVTVTAGP
jgi:hypothetical protein